MTDLTTLQSLRDRVAKATGPVSDLDRDIRHATIPRLEWTGDDIPVTASIDAALDWVERVLPGYAWAVTARPDKFTASVWARSPISRGLPGTMQFHAPTPALAIILAGLNALIAKEKTDD